MQQTLAVKTKFFSKTMKNVLGRFASEIVESPSVFEHLESSFILYEVLDNVKA
jgi:hypothetical protein